MTQKSNIQNFLRGFTAETTPGSATKIADYREHLRPGTVVYITFLPGSHFSDTISVARRLRNEGFIPVPHFAARSIPNEKSFNDYLHQAVGEAGVDRVLCIAGAVDKPVGQYTNSMELLDSGLFDKHGIKRIGLAGHPEGSPDMTDQSIMTAVKWKNSFRERSDAELYLVTQFAFEAEPVIAWDKKLQAEGNKLPIQIGIPGLATLKTLLMHAKACGIGNSMQFLIKQARNVSKLMKVNTPDRLVADLAQYQASDPDSGIDGVHVYPLGGLRRSAKWSYAVTDGDFTLDNQGGFRVDVELD
ncbi:MAG: methylenetetrahydrofolate reductase [Gammaproteobacteria bacterium]|nr:methylenetetrahydrofolate reductase [Gammaproteobacteria bacterium]